MQLARMDDVAGIRLIFQDVPSLVAFRNSFLKSNHNHEKKNSNEKYDYIRAKSEHGDSIKRVGFPYRKRSGDLH